MQNTAKVTNKKEIWSKMDILGFARTLLYQDFILYAFSIAISNYCLKYISNSHSHSHFQQNLKTKVSIISPPRPFSCVATQQFLRRDVIFPASRRRKWQLYRRGFHASHHNCRDKPIQMPGQLLHFAQKCCIFASSMKLIDGALCRTGYRGTAWRRDARYRNWIIH